MKIAIQNHYPFTPEDLSLLVFSILALLLLFPPQYIYHANGHLLSSWGLSSTASGACPSTEEGLAVICGPER